MSEPRRTPTPWTATALVLLVGVGCGASVPLCPTGPRPIASEGEVRVPWPPPPQNVEEIPAQPSPKHTWRDGTWCWADRDWRWAPGSWELVPPGCRLARGALVWVSGGAEPSRDSLRQRRPSRGSNTSLVVLPPLWFREGGGVCTELAPVCP